jgi:hypothetical protein
MKLFPIILLSLFASCSKSALTPQEYKPIHQRWIVQEGHDRASWSAAQFCSADDYGKIDTLDLYYTREPNNPNEFGYVPGSIYFRDRTATEIPDLYDRNYAKLLTLITE